MLNLGKKILDQVPRFIKLFIQVSWLQSVTLGWYDCMALYRFNRFNNAGISIVSSISNPSLANTDIKQFI